MKAGLAMGLVIPDLWQQKAIRALQQGKDVVVQAPTGSGKTYIFELFYRAAQPTRVPLQKACEFMHHNRLMIIKFLSSA